MTAFTNTGRSEALELAKFNVSEQPEAVIEEGQRNDLLDSILKKSRLQSKDDLAQHHNRYEKDAEHLVEPFSL